MKHFLYPNPQVFDHHKAIFVHCPKTGGTSIEQTLKSPSQVCGGHTSAQAYRHHFPDKWESYFTFGFVRDPFSRFISAYTYLKQCPVHPALGNQKVHSCSFPSFLDALEEDSGILRRIVHLTPQNTFLCDENGCVMMDKIYPFEDLSRSWVDICHVLGVGKPLPKMNVSRPMEFSPCDLERAREVVLRLYAEDYRVFESYFTVPA
jgi:hypothetical protein